MVLAIYGRSEIFSSRADRLESKLRYRLFLKKCLVENNELAINRNWRNQNQTPSSKPKWEMNKITNIQNTIMRTNGKPSGLLLPERYKVKHHQNSDLKILAHSCATVGDLRTELY